MGLSEAFQVSFTEASKGLQNRFNVFAGISRCFNTIQGIPRHFRAFQDISERFFMLYMLQLNFKVVSAMFLSVSMRCRA